MADYFPLIQRAVAGLDRNTGENRRALYGRAREMLVSQLRGVVPALDETDITRERIALEEAIRRVESASGRRARPGREIDPLAALAELIGQTDPFGEFGRNVARWSHADTPDFIVEFLDNITTPATTAEIGAALKSGNFFTTDTLLNSALIDLYNEGRIRRVKEDVYQTIKNPPPLDKNPPPLEPLPGPGPQYRPHDGKLSGVISLPAEDEAAKQAGLHRLLSADAEALAKSLQTAGNRYPELANIAREYSNLLNDDVTQIDVTGIWSVGGSLACFARSYREQNIAKTLAEPLEPQLDALLQKVATQHGAFIMGFEEGRDLVRRADEFALDTVRLVEIESSGAALLNELTDNRELVDDRTRALHQPIRDGVVEYGWASSRLGYSAYLIVSNSVQTMIKFSVGEHPDLAAILGILTAGSALAGDPNAEFIRAAVPVLQLHGSQLLAFFNHSPEMRAYVEWALRILNADRDNRP